MRILFYGDSITDAGRERDNDEFSFKLGLGLGLGFANYVAQELSFEKPGHYEFINRGVGGNRVVDLYARIKADCWNHKPDVVSFMVGINDVWPFPDEGNGVELDRYEKVYRMMLDDTLAKLPNVKIILCEPFFLKGSAAEIDYPKWDGAPNVRDYAKAVRKLASEYGFPCLSLQEKLEEKAGDNPGLYLYDGIHPTPAAVKLIATEWLKIFKEQIEK